MFRNLTPVVKNLLILNLLVYVGLLLLHDRVPGLYDWFRLVKVNVFGFRPVGADGNYLIAINGATFATPTGPDDFKPAQLVTHFFTHSLDSFFHILFNMLALFFIGPLVEMAMGSKRFLNFYLFSGLLGGILVTLFDPSPIPVVGASGALSGVLVAFALYYPDQRLIIFPIPVPVRSRYVAWGLGVFSLLMVLLAPHSGGISHFGHLAGMVAAVLFFLSRRFIPG